jgi:pimeloyl-ACP methyl ester carboxylesterase
LGALFCGFGSLVLAQQVRATPSPSFTDSMIARNTISVGGGRRLALNCLGVGSPTVIFETGGEGDIANWKKVGPQISAVARTCFYNRAGFGYSDPISQPVTGDSVTNDLHALIQNAGLKTPVIIVGHSIGGFYATVYAERFPHDVAGLVLIDSAFAGQFQPASEEDRRNDLSHIRQGEARLPKCAQLARDGRMAFDQRHNCIGGFSEPDSAAERAYLTYMIVHPFWYEAELSQSRNFFAGEAGPSEDTLEERQVRRSFGAMPVIALTASDPPTEDWQTTRDKAYQTRVWKLGHDELAARSSRGLSRIVPASGHFIQLDQPQAVIDAVLNVINMVRTGH